MPCVISFGCGYVISSEWIEGLYLPTFFRASSLVLKQSYGWDPIASGETPRDADKTNLS